MAGGETYLGGDALARFRVQVPFPLSFSLEMLLSGADSGTD